MKLENKLAKVISCKRAIEKAPKYVLNKDIPLSAKAKQTILNVIQSDLNMAEQNIQIAIKVRDE